MRNIAMKKTTVEKIYVALTFTGIIIMCAMAVVLLIILMWACYYAGLPM